jgi:glutamate racemase
VIEPGARRAAAVSRGRVGVIATESAVRSEAYPKALARLRPELTVISRACPLFVPLVEEGWHDDPVTAEVAARYLAPLLAAEIDTLVLGCTHYPLLRAVLERAAPGVALVDSAETVAQMVAAGLAEGGLAAAAGTVPEHRFSVTDAGPTFERIAGRILGDPHLALEWVEVV